MKYKLVFLLGFVFWIGTASTANAQLLKSKKAAHEQAPTEEKKKGLFDGLKKKESTPVNEPVKEKTVLRKSHQAAKADVRASKKERKAAEAREEAARARAAVAKAKRKEGQTNRKVVRKEDTADKSREKAEEKKAKSFGDFFKKEKSGNDRD